MSRSRGNYGQGNLTSLAGDQTFWIESHLLVPNFKEPDPESTINLEKFNDFKKLQKVMVVMGRIGAEDTAIIDGVVSDNVEVRGFKVIDFTAQGEDVIFRKEAEMAGITQKLAQREKLTGLNIPEVMFCCPTEEGVDGTWKLSGSAVKIPMTIIS